MLNSRPNAVDLRMASPELMDEIAAGGWQLDRDGMLAIPDAPGLGLQLDREALARYTGGEPLLP